MVKWKKATKKPVEVSARGPISEEETHNVHAGDLKADVGYFIVDDGNARYPVEPDIFYNTYQVPTDVDSIEGWFTVKKKPVEVEVRGPLNTSERVSTMEGDVRANEGDFIIRGVEGEKYPIEPDEFRRLYDYSF